MHNFREQLRYSLQDDSFWEAAYRKAFPNMDRMINTGFDATSQQHGVDRLILLTNKRVLKIDEKKRRKYRGDVLLEYVSNDRTSAPGWIEKDLCLDYIAYAFMDTRKVLMLDYALLRRAWCMYGDAWKRQSVTIRAQNPGYQTLSIAVRTDILQRAMSQAALITL
jgi:hypothetical protein